MVLTQEEMQSIFDADDPTEALVEILNAHLPQEVTSHIGEEIGWPEDEEYEVDEVVFDDDMISAKCSLSFVESQASGCSEMPHKHERFGRFGLVIDSEGGVGFQFDQDQFE